MNTTLLQMMLLRGIQRANGTPLRASILDLSDKAIGLIYKNLGAKEELVGEEICKASDAFMLSMTCTRLHKIFQMTVRKVDAREPCYNRRGDNRCTCRTSHELQFKAWAAGPALESILLPKITFKSMNTVLHSYARFCPHVKEISFHDGGIIERFTTQYFCNRMQLESVTISSPSRRFLETLYRSKSRFTKLVLTDTKPEFVRAVRDLIRSRGPTLKVLNISVALEGLWGQMDGLVASEILCRVLIDAADQVVEIREKYGPPIEIFEISGSPIRTKQMERGVTRKIYLPSGTQTVVSPM